MIKEDYVSFETAKLLEEKGFDIDDCEVHYDPTDHTSYEITLQMAMKWLREKHKCCIVISPEVTDDDGSGGCLWGWSVSIYLVPKHTSEYLYEPYEEACEAAIRYCLENLI